MHPLPTERLLSGRNRSAEGPFIIMRAGQVQKRKGIDDFIRLAENCRNYLYLDKVVFW